MKTIGFVDYYLSEWHANNYPEWIRQTNEKLGTDFRIAYAWAEEHTSPVDGVTSREWCEKNGVCLCDTLNELCQKSDYILVLAPTNPEKHLPYARTVLQYGKPTYIDKTFAPSVTEAREIFSIAKQHNTPFFSTSALRYGAELKELTGAERLTITGGGSNLPEYLVHMVEMAVLLLDDPIQKAMVMRQGEQRFCHVSTASGKEATLVYAAKFPYGIAYECSGTKPLYRAISGGFFMGLMEDILRFYQSGVPSFDPAQTMQVMYMRDAILEADQAPGTWVTV